MKGNEKRCDTADGRTATYRRWAGLAVIAAATAIALAGCGGSSSLSAAGSATVASLTTRAASGDGGSTSSGGASTTTNSPKGNPTKLLDEWAVCMHSHGDPDQADPTIDAHGVINI